MIGYGLSGAISGICFCLRDTYKFKKQNKTKLLISFSAYGFGGSVPYAQFGVSKCSCKDENRGHLRAKSTTRVEEHASRWRNDRNVISRCALRRLHRSMLYKVYKHYGIIPKYNLKLHVVTIKL